MNRRFLRAALLLVFSALIVQAPPVHAASYSSKALIENAKLLDGKAVTYRGEAVTAIMDRGPDAWINVNDGDNAIGIWSKRALLKDVKFLGDYKHRGDILEIDGIFNRACPVHGGELDIHAGAVKVIKAGFLVEELIDLRKAFFAVLLFLVTLTIVIVFRKRI